MVGRVITCHDFVMPPFRALIMANPLDLKAFALSYSRTVRDLYLIDKSAKINAVFSSEVIAIPLVKRHSLTEHKR